MAYLNKRNEVEASFASKQIILPRLFFGIISKIYWGSNYIPKKQNEIDKNQGLLDLVLSIIDL